MKEQPRLEGGGGEKNSQCCGAGRCLEMEGAIVVNLGQEQVLWRQEGEGGRVVARLGGSQKPTW